MKCTQRVAPLISMPNRMDTTMSAMATISVTDDTRHNVLRPAIDMPTRMASDGIKNAICRSTK